MKIFKLAGLLICLSLVNIVDAAAWSYSPVVRSFEQSNCLERESMRRLLKLMDQGRKPIEDLKIKLGANAVCLKPFEQFALATENSASTEEEFSVLSGHFAALTVNRTFATPAIACKAILYSAVCAHLAGEDDYAIQAIGWLFDAGDFLLNEDHVRGYILLDEIFHTTGEVLAQDLLKKSSENIHLVTCDKNTQDELAYRIARAFFSGREPYERCLVRAEMTINFLGIVPVDSVLFKDLDALWCQIQAQKQEGAIKNLSQN